jgi:DNA-directed RNA polymerase subunit RPC12/RpoP
MKHKCPNCGGERTHYVTARVNLKHDTDGSTAAGWYACLDCWAKFNGATDDPDGVLPVGVQAREM